MFTIKLNFLNSENIERIIIDNSFQDNITDLNITEKNSSIYISFLSTNISDAVTLSEKLVNSSNSEIANIKYENFNNKVSAELIFN